MIAFDTTFLVDYLDGVPETRTFLSGREETPLYAPSLVRFETYRGVARTTADVDRVRSGLGWLESLSLTARTAREAALIEAELLDEGTPLNLGDVLVAGICRHNGATLVTRDSHFERVDGLDVRSY